MMGEMGELAEILYVALGRIGERGCRNSLLAMMGYWEMIELADISCFTYQWVGRFQKGISRDQYHMLKCQVIALLHHAL